MNRKFYYALTVVFIATLVYGLTKSNVSENFVDIILPKPNTYIKDNCNNSRGLAFSSLYTSEMPRSLYFKEGRLQDAHYSSRKTPKSYVPPCLTKKPYGNANAIYRWWKKFPQLLSKQYASCDKYTCDNRVENGYNALPRLERCIKTDAGKVEQSETLACDVVNQEYYNSPEQYCRNHPEDYPCPNWWKKNPEQVRDISISPNSCIKNTKVKPQVANTPNKKGFCLAGDPGYDLSDGVGLLMVQRHREDHGLC